MGLELNLRGNDLVVDSVTTSITPTSLTVGSVKILSGSGAPSVLAPKGSLYLNTAGSGVADRAYINTSGSTVWTAVSTVA